MKKNFRIHHYVCGGLHRSAGSAMVMDTALSLQRHFGCSINANAKLKQYVVLRNSNILEPLISSFAEISVCEAQVNVMIWCSKLRLKYVDKLCLSSH